MKRLLLIIALMPFFLTAHAGNWTGNVNFVLGQKTLDSDDWGSLDKQAEFSILVDFKKKTWPVSIAIDLLGSYGEGSGPLLSLEGSTGETDIGVRKVWELTENKIRPFVGAGIAFIGAELKRTGAYLSDDDIGVGYWLNGGVYWTLGRHFNIGLDLRYSQATVTLFGVNRDAGGTHGGLLLGYHW